MLIEHRAAWNCCGRNLVGYVSVGYDDPCWDAVYVCRDTVCAGGDVHFNDRRAGCGESYAVTYYALGSEQSR